jgi:ankyrin repeat protein
MKTLYILSFYIFIATSTLHAAAPKPNLVPAIRDYDLAYINQHLTEDNANSFEDGCSLLHLATWYGHEDIVAKLISYGADVNALNDCNDTPLHLAASWGYQAIIETLLRHGANPTAKASDERTPSDIARDCSFHEIVNIFNNWHDPLEIKEPEVKE